MATIYKAVCDILQRKNVLAEQPSDFCCLCFSPVKEDATQVNDEVIVPTSKGPVSEEMRILILSVLGDEFADNITLLKSVCEECTKSTINSYKFMNTCKDNMELLANTVVDITNGFEIITDDLNDFNTLYLSVNPHNCTMQQYYDTYKDISSQKMALDRFKFIAVEPNVTREESKNKKLGRKSQRPKDFSTIFIKTHELILDPDKPNELKCKICLKMYPTSGSLRQHFFAAHFKKEYQCHLCPKRFGTAGILNTHQQQSHLYVTCDECGKQLRNRSSTIKRHALTHKSGKICHKCGRSYKKITEYNRHIQRDTCEVPSRIPGIYICDYCGKKCSYRHQLSSHIRFEHLGAEGHVCKWCGRKCYNESALKVHVLKHTKEKNFVCDDCGGKFVTRQSLLNHSRLHSGERPYPCAHCDQAFLSASRRTEHVERCHIFASFECDKCGTRYNARRSLLKHKRLYCSNRI